MRTRPRPRPTRAQTLTPVTTHCPECQHRLWADYANFRTVTTLDAVTRLTLHLRRCPNPACFAACAPSSVGRRTRRRSCVVTALPCVPL